MPRRIVLGVTGSIAATKSQSIAIALKKVGFEVRVCMSHSAQKVVSKSALHAVLDTQPYIDMWTSPDGSGETHIEWSKWADAILIAPATASCLSSLWSGSYDSTPTLVAGSLPPTAWYFAPAMAEAMWEQPAVKRNVAELQEWGATFIGPKKGRVASGDVGYRLMEPVEIAEALCKAFRMFSIVA